MRSILIGAACALGLFFAEAEAASVVTDIEITAAGDGVSDAQRDAVLDAFGLALGAVATGSASLEPGSTGVIGDPDNITGFIGANASFTLAGTGATPVISAFATEDFGGVFQFAQGDIDDGRARLSIFPGSLVTSSSFDVAGIDVFDAPFQITDAFVSFTLENDMPVGLAVIEIALETVDPDFFAVALPNSGTLRIAIDFGPAPVPVPGGVVLFATGLAALGARRRLR